MTNFYEEFIGKPVMVFCSNYIYAGTVTKVTTSHIELGDAKIVYETGAYTERGYKDAQALPGNTWCIATQAIESIGSGK